jgi:hypothetical protein
MATELHDDLLQQNHLGADINSSLEFRQNVAFEASLHSLVTNYSRQSMSPTKGNL